jgi:hypothetical protein
MSFRFSGLTSYQSRVAATWAHVSNCYRKVDPAAIVRANPSSDLFG